MHYSSCFIDNMSVDDMLMSFSKHNLFTTVEKIHEFSLPTALQINAAIFHHPSPPLQQTQVIPYNGYLIIALYSKRCIQRLYGSV